MQAKPTPTENQWRPKFDRALSARVRAYSIFYSDSPVERIGMVRAGLPARVLTALADDMDVNRDRLYGWIGITRATANRKAKSDGVLNPDESERALGIASLVGQVERIVHESGQPQAGFDAAKWTAAWLEQPNHALGGKAPGEYMDTADGRALVSRLVAQMQSGAYA